MLNHISWADYTSTIIAVTIVYYLFVIAYYYGRDIIYYVSLKTNGSRDQPGLLWQDPVASISDELNAFIAENARNGSDKVSILSGARCILQRFPIQQDAGGKIEETITRLCEQYCSVHLADDELKGLWL